MNVGKVVYQLLIDSADLQAIVGDKIYPLALSEDRIHPCIVYAVDSNSLIAKDVVGVFECKIKLDLFANSYQEAKQIAALVRGLLDRYEGTQHGVTVKWLSFENESELIDEKLQFHQITQDYQSIII